MRYDFDLEERKISSQTLLKVLITFVEAVIVIFAAFMITHYGLEIMTVSGEFMSPNLVDGDTILINKMSYKMHKVHRFDVIVTQENGSEHSYFALQRVIGLPGEKIEIKDGLVYINGKELKQKMNFPLIENGGMANHPITLEKGEYFVLGDNRNECEDSRYASIGNIQKENIVGKAWIRMNSFTFVRMINHFKNEDASSQEEET